MPDSQSFINALSQEEFEELQEAFLAVQEAKNNQEEVDKALS